MIIIFSQRHNYISELALKVFAHIEQAPYYVNTEKKLATFNNNNKTKCCTNARKEAATKK